MHRKTAHQNREVVKNVYNVATLVPPAISFLAASLYMGGSLRTILMATGRLYFLSVHASTFPYVPEPSLAVITYLP